MILTMFFARREEVTDRESIIERFSADARRSAAFGIAEDGNMI
jgi:hypothetical protein